MPLTVAWPTVRAFALEAAACAALVAALTWWWHPVAAAVGMVVIATRQHALFILYHDAVHGLVARPMRLNDAIVNTFAGVPMLLPVHVYRSLHLAHHHHLGTGRDPERVLLYVGQDWDYRPLPLRKLVRQVLFDTLLVNQLKTLWGYVRERLVGGTLKLPPSRAHPELALQGLAFWVPALAFAWFEPTLALRAAVLWLVPLLTLTQGLQKVRSFAEHGPDPADPSGSWAPGPLGRFVLWPYNIQFHREHHARPGIPWFELPRAFPDRTARPGRALVAWVWDGTL